MVSRGGADQAATGLGKAIGNGLSAMALALTRLSASPVRITAPLSTWLRRRPA
jgi:hypothetical protein